MIFIDASFYISLSLYTDTNHKKAVRIAPYIKQQKITSEDILKETLTVISQRQGKSTSMKVSNEIASDTKILPVTSTRFHSGLELFTEKDLQKDISLIDCISAAICHELKIKQILTFDPHFRSFGLKTLP